MKKIIILLFISIISSMFISCEKIIIINPNDIEQEDSVYYIEEYSPIKKVKGLLGTWFYENKDWSQTIIINSNYTIDKLNYKTGIHEIDEGVPYIKSNNIIIFESDKLGDIQYNYVLDDYTKDTLTLIDSNNDSIKYIRLQ